MKRDICDFHEVRPIHAEVHARLENWARWCRGGRGGTATLAMFQQYRHGYEEPTASSTVDTLDGHAVEKLVIALPEKHRTVLQWWYVKPFIPLWKVRKALALSTPAMFDLVHDARSMLKNRS